MRKALAAFGVASTLLVCAPASATIVIEPTSATNSDPALGAILSPPISSTSTYETFDAKSVGTTGTFSTAFATFSGSGMVVNGFATNQYAAPFFGPTPGTADPTNYLATTGTEKITFGAEHSVFALYWGSIDTYNTISFYNGNTLVASFTGSAVLPPANGNQGSFTTNADVEFSNLGLFNTVVLSSTSAAFEVDNLQVGPAITSTPPVPEASTWMMMILGFFSVGFMAYRRKGRAMQLRIA